MQGHEASRGLFATAELLVYQREKKQKLLTTGRAVDT